MPRLRVTGIVAEAALGVPLTMCGELAGKPIEALALMSVGGDAPMGPPSIGPIKEMVLASTPSRPRARCWARLLEG